MKKKILIVSLLLFFIIYFEYSVTITWDSAHYLGYVKVFEGKVPFSSWDVVRGPVFPFIIFFSNFLFGKTNQGLVINSFVFYLVMLFFSYKIVKCNIEYFRIGSKIKNFICFIVMSLIMINPIIFGFYHSLLTEFVAITIAVISCYYSFVWLKIDFYKERGKYLLISIIFVFLTLFSWFLKQPYVSCGFFGLFVAYIISVFQYKKKQLVVRTTTVLICVLFLLLGINMWDVFLSSKGVFTDSNRNPTNSLGNQIINAVDYLEIDSSESIYDSFFIQSSKLSSNEKKEVNKLIDNGFKYILVYKYNGNKIISADYIKSNRGDAISVFDALKYLLKVFINNPIKLLNSYITNYFSIIDIYRTKTFNGFSYSSDKRFDLTFSNEIATIGNKIFVDSSTNLFYLSKGFNENASRYVSSNNNNRILNGIMLFLAKIFLLLFKLMFFLLPLLLISSIVLRFSVKYRKYYNVLNFLIILFGFSFLHLLLHTVTGAIIDRYALPALVPTFLGMNIFFIMCFFKNKLSD